MHLCLVHPLDVIEYALEAAKLRQRLTRLPARVHVAPALPFHVELSRVPRVCAWLRTLALPIWQHKDKLFVAPLHWCLINTNLKLYAVLPSMPKDFITVMAAANFFSTLFW